MIKRKRQNSITELESALKRAHKAELELIKTDTKAKGYIYISSEQMDAKIRIMFLEHYLTRSRESLTYTDAWFEHLANTACTWYRKVK